MKANGDTHHFVLVLSGVSEPDGELEDALFEAGCDGTLGFRDEVAYLELDRQAPSMEAAIVSAVRDVERADPRLKVVAVESAGVGRD